LSINSELIAHNRCQAAYELKCIGLVQKLQFLNKSIEELKHDRQSEKEQRQYKQQIKRQRQQYEFEIQQKK
jgi:hypothetical protein